jgi:hypothetical protein
MHSQISLAVLAAAFCCHDYRDTLRVTDRARRLPRFAATFAGAFSFC